MRYDCEMMIKKNRFKIFLFYTITLSFTFIVCFLLLEFGYARFYYSNYDRIKDKVFDPEIGWLLKPGQYQVKPSHTFLRHTIHINQYGLRSRLNGYEPTVGGKKIMVLGDSFVFGKAIRTEDIFTTRLERGLNKNASTNHEVINGGVPGYGNAQQLLFLKRLSDQGILGDIYLLVLFTNDILDNLRLKYHNAALQTRQPGFILNKNGHLEYKYAPQDKTDRENGNIVQRKKKESLFKLIEVLQINIESFVQTKPNLISFANQLGFNVNMQRMPGLLTGWYRQDIIDTGLPLMKALISEINNEVENRGSRLLISLIPSALQVYPNSYKPLLESTFPDSEQVKTFFSDIERPNRNVEKICQDLDIPFLDLYPILKQSNDQDFYIPREGHLNGKGHALVADSLMEFILDQEREKAGSESGEPKG